MNRNYNIIGIFEKRDYPLKITIEGNGTVEEQIVQQKSTDYPYRTIVELMAYPDNGWQFIEWGGDIVGGKNPILITMGVEFNIKVIFNDWNDVYNPATGRTWMDRNLRAYRVATSHDDELSYGDLYQWGRGADGHQIRNSSTTSILSLTSDQPGHGSFILAPNTPYDWRSCSAPLCGETQNDNLWQGVNGVNNPCPAGYRIPTIEEWSEEIESWDSEWYANRFPSPLNLPIVGSRSHRNGVVNTSPNFGQYWSSSVSGSNVFYLSYDPYNLNFMLRSGYRATGRSVRCIKN
jgi:uncharacterized protein (TIGR02145 family)